MTAHASLLLFMKLLTRNTFADDSVQPTDPAAKGDSSTKQADIFNLISNETGELRAVGTQVITGLKTLVSVACGCIFAWQLLGISGLVGLMSMILVIVPAYFMLKQMYRLHGAILRLGDERIALLKEAVHAIAMIKSMAYERSWFLRLLRLRDRSYSKLFQRHLLEDLSGVLL